MPKKKKQNGDPELHKDLKGFNIRIDEFGEISTNLPVDNLNNFLNENVDDKKLREREDSSQEEEDEEEDKD